jgi:hypothetical protein
MMRKIMIVNDDDCWARAVLHNIFQFILLITAHDHMSDWIAMNCMMHDEDDEDESE